MFKILKSITEKVDNGTVYCRVEVAVDSAASLVTELPGRKFTSASIGWDLSTGDFYRLLEGTWYKQGETV